jgi:hypothetical protein
MPKQKEPQPNTYFPSGTTVVATMTFSGPPADPRQGMSVRIKKDTKGQVDRSLPSVRTDHGMSDPLVCVTFERHELRPVSMAVPVGNIKAI